MGQKLLDDKIGTLSHSSGVISLTASRVTLGGQQYATTSTINRTISTDVTLAANTLYMIYAVLNAGAVELRISANVNSVGPTGFNSWKLVGAFYADNSSPILLGSFVSIESVPQSDWINGGTIQITAATTAPTKSGVVLDVARYKRSGSDLIFKYQFRQTSAGTAGSGYYKFAMPTPFAPDTTKISLPDSVTNFVGSGWVSSNAEGRDIMVAILDSETNKFVLAYANGTNAYVGSSVVGMGNGTYQFSFEARFPVLGLSNTPLKDL